jgi:hypothetical protein
MSTSAIKDETPKSNQWTVISTAGDRAAFEIGDDWLVGAPLPDEAVLDTIVVEYVMPDAPWIMTATIKTGGRSAVLRSVRIDPKDHEGDEILSSRLLRSLGQPKFRDVIRDGLDQLSAVLNTADMMSLAPARPGRRERPDSYWASLAAEWLRAFDDDPTRPSALAAERSDRTSDQWRSYLDRAAERGLFERTKGEPGRAGGGRLTPRGHAALLARKS